MAFSRRALTIATSRKRGGDPRPGPDSGPDDQPPRLRSPAMAKADGIDPGGDAPAIRDAVPLDPMSSRRPPRARTAIARPRRSTRVRSTRLGRASANSIRTGPRVGFGPIRSRRNSSGFVAGTARTFAQPWPSAPIVPQPAAFSSGESDRRSTSSSSRSRNGARLVGEPVVARERVHRGPGAAEAESAVSWKRCCARRRSGCR